MLACGISVPDFTMRSQTRRIFDWMGGTIVWFILKLVSDSQLPIIQTPVELIDLIKDTTSQCHIIGGFHEIKSILYHFKSYLHLILHNKDSRNGAEENVPKWILLKNYLKIFFFCKYIKKSIH
jgi:hypothetical protein